MKALSIIGIVLSTIGVIIGVGVIANDQLSVMTLVVFVIMLFFLAFSITATAVSFRRKNRQI